MQARLHDKYLIIDDQMYTLGGRNTTNLFLGDYSKGTKTSTRSCLFTKQIRAKICKTLLCPSFRLILIPYGILLTANRCRGSRNGKRRSKKQKALKKHYKELTEKISCRIRKTKLGRTDI